MPVAPGLLEDKVEWEGEEVVEDDESRDEEKGDSQEEVTEGGEQWR